ncbi:hypothetical protein A9R05_40100 (plasmid) [Burkholderia sp. KK1]|nr:hypothetical protein A9R05_38900 [Burkholderia sp. KK1]AQH05198.1 hypothetical protein A9R05_40100 [Burkholderia sp. KK1]
MLCAMQHAQDAHAVAADPIGCDVRRSAYDQFTSPFDATQPASFRELKQLADLSANPIIDRNGSTRALGFDVIENAVSVLKREDRPFKPHASPFDFTQRCCATFSEMGVHVIVRNSRPRIR